MEACDTNHAGSTGNKTGIGRTQSPDVSPLHSPCPVHRLILPCPLSHHNQMLFKTRSAAVYGIEAYLVDVEVNISTAFPIRPFANPGIASFLRSATTDSARLTNALSLTWVPPM